MDIKYIKQLQIDNLSDKLKNEQLSAGFYIKINSGYTATVRTILSLTVKDFAVFQNGANKHQFVQCTENVETISIRTRDGKKITVCVMDKAKCVDVKYHTDKKSFKIIGFNEVGPAIPTEEVTLTTILL